MSATRFVVGLDAGGSKTLLRAECTDCSEAVERRGPGANPNRIGLDNAAEVLVDLIRETVRGHSDVDELSVCAGVSGAGRAHEQEDLAGALERALSSPDWTVRVDVVHDALIALDAAYDTGSGLIVIAGTGSVVLARTTDGTLLRAGGWGHLLGDPGSGYAIGKAGLRAVAESFDGGENTTLRDRVREHFGIENREHLIQKIYQEEFTVQAVAPLVIDTATEGDAVASRILTTQAAGLTEQVEWLLNREKEIAPRITLLGGMVQNEYYKHVLRRILREHVPAWSVGVLQDEPVVGALRRARRLQSEVAE